MDPKILFHSVLQSLPNAAPRPISLVHWEQHAFKEPGFNEDFDSMASIEPPCISERAHR